MRKQKEAEEEYEEHKTNFDSAYLCDGRVDLTKIWNEMCPIPKDFPQQKWCSSIQALLSYRCMKMAFSWFLYKTHSSVTCPHWLYLAAQ